MGAAPTPPIQYQNPSSANVSLVLDAEQVGIDNTTGTPVDITREYVVAQESINAGDPLYKIGDLLQSILLELKNIRNILEADVPPQLLEDITLESEDTLGTEEADSGAEGITEN